MYAELEVPVADIVWMGWGAALLAALQRTLHTENHAMRAALEEAIIAFIADDHEAAVRSYCEFSAWLQSNSERSAYTDAVKEVAEMIGGTCSC